MARHLSGDHFAGFGAKYADQADSLLLAAQRIPRQPETVRIAKLGLAVMVRKLLGGKNELAIRRSVFGGTFLVLESVDDQFAINSDGLVLRIVEVNATAESPRRRSIGLIDHRIGPEADHLVRDLFFVGAVRVPDLGNLFSPGCRNANIHFWRSAAERRDYDERQKSNGAPGGHFFGGHCCLLVVAAVGAAARRISVAEIARIWRPSSEIQTLASSAAIINSCLLVFKILHDYPGRFRRW